VQRKWNIAIDFSVKPMVANALTNPIYLLTLFNPAQKEKKSHKREQKVSYTYFIELNLTIQTSKKPETVIFSV